MTEAEGEPGSDDWGWGEYVNDVDDLILVQIGWNFDPTSSKPWQSSSRMPKLGLQGNSA